MSEWKKQEFSVLPSQEEAMAVTGTPETAEMPGATEAAEAETTEAAEGKGHSPAPSRSRNPRRNASAETASYTRLSARGVRRGRYRFAAWLGLVVLLLAAVGAVTLISLGVRLVQKTTDHSELKIELADFADSLIEYPPDAFENIEEADMDDLLLAAICRLREIDRIEQLRTGADASRYISDDYGRLIISADEVAASFAVLYGNEIAPVHQTIGNVAGIAYTYEYNKTNAWYHVPVSSSSSLYTTVVDNIRVSGKSATLRVGYALTSTLGYDHRGDLNTPTEDQFSLYRYFTFTQTENGWVLTKLVQEALSSATDPTISPTSSATTTTTSRSTTTTTAIEASEPTEPSEIAEE